MKTAFVKEVVINQVIVNEEWNTASARVYVEWNTAWVYLCLYLRTVLRKNGGHVVDVLFIYAKRYL